MKKKFYLFFLIITLNSYSQQYIIGNKLSPTSTNFKLVSISSKTNVYMYKYIGIMTTNTLFNRKIDEIYVGVKNDRIVSTLYNLIPLKNDVNVPQSIIELYNSKTPYKIECKNNICGVNIDDMFISFSRVNNALTSYKDRIMYFCGIHNDKLTND